MIDITNEDVINGYGDVPYHQIENFGEQGDLTRQYLLNPALFTLLGNIQEVSILDAGSGQGYLSRLLAKQGARVTGVEPSERFFEYGYQREQKELLGIQYIQADLSTWVPTPESFDVVIANMVFMDIPDYEAALKNCVAALRPGGRLIFSILHPCFEEPGAAWREKGFVAVQEYFQEQAIKQTYGYFIHRTLSSYINSVIRAGCAIDQLLEPQLQAEIAALHNAERYASVPGYLIIAATKHSA